MPDKNYLQDAAKDVARRLPDGHVFILLTAPIGAGGRLSYVSNMEREDAIKTLKEFLFRCGAQEDWMKHLE